MNTDIRDYFTEPDRCLSLSWIFRCKKPVGHEGEHRAGNTTWGRRAEDERHDNHEPGVVAYRSEDGHFLRCLQHAPDPGLKVELFPVTSEDLPDGGHCTDLWCRADVLAVADDVQAVVTPEKTETLPPQIADSTEAP